MNKKRKHIDLQYADKETRDRLGDKSLICFETRGKWKKLAASLNMDINLIEKQMDEIIKLKDEQKGELNVTPRIRTTRKARRKYLRDFAKKMRRNKFKKRDQIRLGQDTDGTTTAESVGRNSESNDVRGEEV